MSEKVRLLVITANPPPSGRIRVDAEAAQIIRRLNEGPASGAFNLFVHPGLKLDDLQRVLMNFRPHIVHFGVHGSLRKRIVLENSRGRGKQVPPGALAEVFRLHQETVRLVVLNACYTRPQGLALVETVDFVVGVRETIGDRAAVTFAGAFYSALSHGWPVRKAFESGRAELSLLGIPSGDTLELLEREGRDASRVVFPPPAPPRLPEGDALRSALARLSAGTATPEDTELVRQASFDGRLVLEQTGEAVGGALEADEDTADSLRVFADAATYRRIQERLYPPPPGIEPPLPGLIFIGRDKSLSHLNKLLHSSGAEGPDSQLTVVRGWPGVGKTTLVGVVGRDPEILKTFPDGVLWTSLERQPELLAKMAEWARSLTGNDEFFRIPTLDEAVPRLGALLRRRRMLLIVDDIWDAAHAVPFVRAAAGSSCALLATTRKTQVAEALTPVEKRIYFLPELTEKYALELLGRLAPSVVRQYREECRELVSDLGYLPLALHVAGRLLRAEAKSGLGVIDLIESIKEGAKLFAEPAPIDRAEGATLPTVRALLKKSTDDLDERTREYFACLGVFIPKPVTFDLEALASVWETRDPTPVIRRLVDYGLLEPAGGGRFQMHELLIKHARSLLTGDATENEVSPAM